MTIRVNEWQVNITGSPNKGTIRFYSRTLCTCTLDEGEGHLRFYGVGIQSCLLLVRVIIVHVVKMDS